MFIVRDTVCDVFRRQIPHVTQPVIGRLYAALVEGEWHRVEVTILKSLFFRYSFIGNCDIRSVQH